MKSEWVLEGTEHKFTDWINSLKKKTRHFPIVFMFDNIGRIINVYLRKTKS